MDTEKLVNDPKLKEQLTELRETIQSPEHAVSDVVDGAGNQYIDLVMEGGGMLGIALVGYTWALEEMGIRFRGIGGTSAGSINALLLASMGKPAEQKSSQLLTEMANLDFYSFVDGGSNVRELIELVLGEDRAFRKLRIAWKAFGVKKKLCTSYGLNKGDEFLNWLARLLQQADVHTLEDLNKKLAIMPAGLRVRNGQAFTDNDWPKAELVIISADVTTETRVEFPRMAPLYWNNPETVSPAVFARASMSIPFFFEPLRVSSLPNDTRAMRNWSQLAGYAVGIDPTAVIPENVMFVDGGVMSNFPIDAFHDNFKAPRLPTFGVKLEYDQRYKPTNKFPLKGKGRLNSLGPVAGAIFNSARHTLDYEFIKKNPDYRHLVQFIPCIYKDRNSGEMKNYNWLDFNMSEEHRAGLFVQGAMRAIEFIRQFSGPVDKQGRVTDADDAAFKSKWSFYKDLRQRLLQ
jgi:NTE family protein